MSSKRIAFYIAALALFGYLLYRVWPAAPATDEPDEPSAPVAERRSAPAQPGVWRPTSTASGPLTTIAGRVRDASTHAALAQVTLRFSADSGEGSASSGGDGRYQVELPAGRYRVALSATGYVAAANLPALRVEAGAAVDGLDFVLYRLARVQGRVVDHRGQPLAGARVEVSRARGPRPLAVAGVKTETDDQGRFALAVPPSEVVLRAEARDVGSVIGSPIYLRPGADVTGVELVIGGGLSLAGRVVGPGGQQVQGASAYLRDELGLRQVRAGDDGRFVFSGLVAGPKRLQALASGYSPSRVTGATVQAGASQELTIRLAERVGVAGAVLDHRGQPVAGAEVTLSAGTPRAPLVQLAPKASTTSDDSGRFAFDSTPDLPLTVTARGAGTTWARRSGVRPGTRDIVLRLQQTGGIVGQVTAGSHGQPVTAFALDLRGYHSAQRYRVVSADGRYRIDGLVAGRYRLLVSSAAYGPTTIERIDVIAGNNVTADAVLNAGGRITGVVVDTRGMPVPGARVRMESGWAGEPATTDAAGNFVLENVARGRRSITVSHASYDTRIVAGVSVFAGNSAAVRVELTPSGGKGPGLSLSGIGAVLAERKGALRVVSVMAGSPALVAGLRANDIVLSIEGRPAKEMGFSEAIEAIRGRVGTPVRLELQRGGERFAVDVVRQDVTVSKHG